MEHLVPWLVAAVILFGWFRQGMRALRRLSAAAETSAGTSAETIAARARARAGQPPALLAGAARPTSAAPAAPRTTVPSRAAAPARAATPAQPAMPPRPVLAAPGPRPVAASAEPALVDPARAVTAALAHGPTLRTAIVVAELLAPPVALR